MMVSSTNSLLYHSMYFIHYLNIVLSSLVMVTQYLVISYMLLYLHNYFGHCLQILYNLLMALVVDSYLRSLYLIDSSCYNFMLHHIRLHYCSYMSMLLTVLSNMLPVFMMPLLLMRLYSKMLMSG